MAGPMNPFNPLSDSIFTLHRKHLEAQAQAADEMIKLMVATHGCGLADLRLHIYPDGTQKVRLVSREEKWLDWLSSNH
jgi:hypothetical protein